MVAEWMHTLYGVVRAERITPPLASRLLGYASVALYEGLAAATPSLNSLTGVLTAAPELPRAAPDLSYDPTLVAVEAERTVLDSLLADGLPTTQATVAGLVDSLRRLRTEFGVSEEVAVRSEELGRRIGLAIVAWSRGDGFDSTRAMAYRPPAGPGLWVNDAPGSIYTAQMTSSVTQTVALDNPADTLRAGSATDRNLILNRPKRSGGTDLPALDPSGATEPYWGSLRPFMLTRWNECPLAPPPPYSAEPGSALYREAMEVYDVGMQLTPEQRAIALYWADNPGETGTPAGHWVAIAGQLVTQRDLSAEDAARLFVLTGVAQADAFIAAWGYKYHYSLIRPRTYIRRVIDPDWEPLVPTPPFPEYPSGHSTQSAAASAVVASVLGEVAFEDSTSIFIGHPVRRFGSFDDAAEEAGWSRIYGGIHFHAGKSAGKAVGSCIGETIVERLRSTSPP